MIGMTIKEVKMYFGRGDALMRAVDRAKWRVHTRFGAFVRSDARQSIRNRRRSARPGEAPSNQMGHLRGHIYFVATLDNVIIGPALLQGRGMGYEPYKVVTVPELLEDGSTVTDREGEIHFYAEHPYMGPAFEKNKQEALPKLWADSVKR